MLGFDGRDVAIENISVSAPEGMLAARGHVSSVFGTPHVSIDYASVIDPEKASRWIDAPGWSGAIDVEGHLLVATVNFPFVATENRTL